MTLRVFIFLCLSLPVGTAPLEAAVVLPRVAAVIEIDPVTSKAPWDDRASRVQWVLARLQCEGHRVWLLAPKGPLAGYEVLYLDGPEFNGNLESAAAQPPGLLQSANRMVLEVPSSKRVVRASAGVSLVYQTFGSRRVVTVIPDLAECFADDEALQALGEAIPWLAGLPAGTPRVSPFPYGKRSALILLVHGEGYPERMETFSREFLNLPVAMTYAVSEKAIRRYPGIVKAFAAHPAHEVAIHPHGFHEYQNQGAILSAHLTLHRDALDGHRPKGLVGPYLAYFDDLREALTEYRMRWFVDKDLPYPINVPAAPDEEPIIDITESLKPYDGWWKRRDALSLWQRGLTWKRLHQEMAVCSWHDSHMAVEPAPYREFLSWVRTLPDVWQPTALQFQSFWRDRWRARIEILSETPQAVTLKASSAPAGTTLLRSRNGKTEFAVLDQPSAERTTVRWRPLPPVEDRAEGQGIAVMWSPIGSLSPRNGLDTEFAVVHAGREALRHQPVTVRLPEELRSRISKVLPTVLRVSTSGIKGLEFQELVTREIKTRAEIPVDLSFDVDRFPGESIRYFRLHFPGTEKTGPWGRWQRSLKKRPLASGLAGLVVLLLIALALRAIRPRPVKMKKD